jgi:hypothetical protein
MSVSEASSPNLFEVSGEGVQVTYSTTSIDGQPRLSYTDASRQLNFAGAEIRTVQTELGTEVTVTLETVPDLHTITFTLLLPDFRLGYGNESQFGTLGITTTNHTTIAGPPEGPGQTYEVVVLEGTARAVTF